MTCSQLSAIIAVALPTKKKRKPRCWSAANDTRFAGGTAVAARPAAATSFVMRTVCQTTGFARLSGLQPCADEARHQLDGVRIAQRRAVAQARYHLYLPVAQLQRHLFGVRGRDVLIGAAVYQQHWNMNALRQQRCRQVLRIAAVARPKARPQALDDVGAQAERDAEGLEQIAD